MEAKGAPPEEQFEEIREQVCAVRALSVVLRCRS